MEKKTCVHAKFKYEESQEAGKSARQSSSALEAGTGDWSSFCIAVLYFSFPFPSLKAQHKSGLEMHLQ